VITSRLRAAFVMLTRLPFASPSLEDVHFRRSAAMHPWVGLAVGVIAAFAFAVGSAAGPVVGGICALAMSALVTGAMHEDGLADCADAFFGTTDEARARVILKDPRLGTFGAVALFVVLSLRVATLPTLLEHAMANLVLAATLGRFAMLVVLRRATYAGDPETQKTGPVDAPSGVDLAIAASAPALVALLAYLDHRVSEEGLCLAAVGTVITGLATARFARQRLGGWVGDVLGATEQLAECAVLFALYALPPG
jgi:adenosylcobinamide-GDP ribazoletransferase